MNITSKNSHPSRILVVDDDPLNLEIIAENLECTDYELIATEDGSQAWSILEKDPESIDLVLLDRMLPGLDGLEILTNMKAHPTLKHVPVILQSALDKKQDIIDGIQAGAFYYLTKPFEEELLRSVIKTALDDHGVYVSLRNELNKSDCTLSLMASGIFHFRTLDEMQALALYISKACPKPEQALSGLSELMFNAIEHGNLGIDYDEKSELIDSGRWQEEIEHRLSQTNNVDKFATLNFENNDDHVNITITDMGNGFDWKDYLEISMDRIADNHGRGIAMAKVLSFDAIEYQGNGNSVTTTINREITDPNEAGADVQLELV